ncbi:MAG: beta-ketoacyl synthase chain length factor [Bacteroidales bacterium]|jgi:hypothetical protein|nr:beta-ketoacyl synthase chain length factor [Bacteroidales bacterium]
MNNAYINSVKHISAQQPLWDDWFENPSFYSEPYIRAIEPDYKLFFTPNEVRRYGKILKRALLVSRLTMKESGVLSPDAIITGTGLGCIESTEIFLDKLTRDGEEFLNPTHFMQSTHNTIGSLIAIDSKCNSYNCTYAHKGISFECALLDAFLQLHHKSIVNSKTTRNLLVGAHDEMTPAYYNLLKKTSYLGNPKQTFAGETAVAMMLSNKNTDKTLCKIEAVQKIYKGVGAVLKLEDITAIREIKNIDFIMIGVNGVEENDKIYFENCAKLFPKIPLLQYKNIFGESYTASALGVYAAATCLRRGTIPDFLMCNSRKQISNVHDSSQENRSSQFLQSQSKILCYNHIENKNHTFILLSK